MVLHPTHTSRAVRHALIISCLYYVQLCHEGIVPVVLINIAHVVELYPGMWRLDDGKIPF